MALSDTLTILTLLLALCTWLLSSLRDRQARVLAHTADIMGRSSDCEHITAADYRIHCLIKERETLGSVATHDDSTLKAAHTMLNYYEFNCELCDKGILDFKTVDHLRGGMMARTFRICESYINSLRAEQHRGELYEKLQTFTIAREIRESLAQQRTAPFAHRVL